MRVLCLGLLLLLNACSVWQSQDGPPPFAVNVDRIPNAVPKDEPRSRYGNPRTYRVHGRRYHVLRSSRGFYERGIASWYGSKFHSRRTSSGEPYSMYKMTAAHKSLPIPTYVRVTNLRNHKQIIVKVNDRGPFVDNRIIDLSYVAAKKIGMTQKGTALVSIEAIDPKRPYQRYQQTPGSTAASVPVIRHGAGAPIIQAKTEAVHADTRRVKPQLSPNPKNDAHVENAEIYLQIGAFSELARARAIQQKAQHLVNLPVHIRQFLPDQIYKVQIGPITSVEETDKMDVFLRKHGIEQPFVVIL